MTSVSASSPHPQASQRLTRQSPRMCAAATHAPMTADPAVWALTQTGISTLSAVGPLSGPSHCLTMQCLTSWRDGLGRLGFNRLLSFKNTCLGAASSLLGLPDPQDTRWDSVGSGAQTPHHDARPTSPPGRPPESQPPLCPTWTRFGPHF